jgi:hypothetical protein
MDRGHENIWHGAGEPAGHRLHLNYHFLFPTPEGGGKTRLGGEVRREEQLPRAGMSTDRDGTDEDLSEGFFHMPFPLAPARPESHGPEVRQVRLD